MTYRDWLPSLWSEDKADVAHPFSDLRKRIDTLFEDFDSAMPLGKGDFAVRSNVSETDKEIRITVELPGVEDKDMDISVSENRITIKGEKKSEKEEKGEKEGREFHRVERSSGSFQRSMSVPFKIDGDAVNADFKNGVLTVTIPKPPEVIAETKKIEIKSAA
jgi:HSP20 family protein